jgi:hypothetical protein
MIVRHPRNFSSFMSLESRPNTDPSFYLNTPDYIRKERPRHCLHRALPK